VARFFPPDEGPAAESLRILIGFLLNKAMPPVWAVEEVVAALDRYDMAEVSSMGEAFGFPWNKRLAARRSEILAPQIALAVDCVQREAERKGKSIPLQSSRDVVGAFELVGKDFNMAAATVKKYRDAWLTYCKALGVERSDPDTICRDAW